MSESKKFSRVKVSVSFVLLFLNASNIYAKDIVFVSILPQQFFVQYLADDFVEVNVLVKPGQSPETFDPTPRQMAKLSRAELFFTLGLAFEQRIIHRIIDNNKQLKIVETHQNVQKIENDPHIWLDPQLVKLQVEKIHQALQDNYPQHKIKLQQRFTELLKEFVLLDNSISALLVSKDNKTSFVIFHPALSYFAQRYQLNQIAIEKEGKHSSAKYLARLMSGLKSQSVKFILVEKQFSQKEALTIAKVLNAKLLEVDPLAFSWFKNMKLISQQVQLALF